MKGKARFTALGINTLLLVSSSVLFTLAHPNRLIHTGLPLLAYGIFIPFFLLVRRISFFSSLLWGGLFGALNYCLFGYWLLVFHPLALYIIAFEYFVYYSITVLLLKLADIYFPQHGFIVQWLIWIGYEYIRTLGFLGFSYGLIGYSQWSCIPIIQIASLFGVWAVSALVVFPSAWIAAAFKQYCTKPIRYWKQGAFDFARAHWLSAALWLVCFCSTVLFGVLSPKTYDTLPQRKIALIQPNTDPWVGGTAAYKKDLALLKKLSDEALRAHPDISLVVWPETAFVPRIDWHYRYREDREAFEIVYELLHYLNDKTVPFLIGNDDAVNAAVDIGIEDRLDYNAALLFRPRQNVLPPSPERYRKMHLVPFTEHFPYKRQFPFIYALLEASDTHFWAKGDDPHVFAVDDLVFSVPICFEDTFGYLTRKFARQGARLIVNMSNDAWAKSVPCQYQHLSMAVFRAVENRLPMVRATASGQTAAISPHGRVSALLDPFVQGYLCVTVPVYAENSQTLYTRWGDWFALLFTAAAVLFLCIGLLRHFIWKRKVQ